MELKNYAVLSRPLKNATKQRYHPYGGALLPRKFENQHYYGKRYELFHRFDQNVQLDEEMLFSVCPERIAVQEARHLLQLFQQEQMKSSEQKTIPLKPKLVDLFGGVGGFAVQLARFFRVVTVELSAERCSMLSHNAAIYEQQLTVVQGDCFKQRQLLEMVQPDVVTISPPWGGIDYVRRGFDVDAMEIGGRKFTELFEFIEAPIVYAVLPKQFVGRISEDYEWEIRDCGVFFGALGVRKTDCGE